MRSSSVSLDKDDLHYVVPTTVIQQGFLKRYGVYTDVIYRHLLPWQCLSSYHFLFTDRLCVNELLSKCYTCTHFTLMFYWCSHD